MFALSQNPRATVKDSWEGSWNPILNGALLDLRVKDLLSMQNALIHLQPLFGIHFFE